MTFVRRSSSGRLLTRSCILESSHSDVQALASTLDEAME